VFKGEKTNGAYNCLYTKDIQEAQLPLREQGVSFVLLSHHNTTH